MSPLVVTASIVIPIADLSWTSVRASGPGGQNVNKVASKVELRFDLRGTRALAPPIKDRLTPLVRSRLDADGRVIIVSQHTRDRERNLQDALARLKELILRAVEPPKRRKATKPSWGSRLERVSDKRAHAQKKQARGRPGRDD